MDVDQNSFVQTSMESVGDDVRTTAGPILELLKEFDLAGDGVIDAGVLKHLLSNVSTPSKLSIEEVRQHNAMQLSSIFCFRSYRQPCCPRGSVLTISAVRNMHFADVRLSQDARSHWG